MKTRTFSTNVRLWVTGVRRYRGLTHLEVTFLHKGFSGEKLLRADSDNRWRRVRVIELPCNEVREVRGLYDNATYVMPMDKDTVNFEEVTVLQDSKSNTYRDIFDECWDVSEILRKLKRRFGAE